MEVLPTYSDVLDAAEKLRGVAVQTPLLRNRALDEVVGVPVYVKCEPLQQTGSFKIRGAYNRLCRLTADERLSGVVAFSSGNHAQGVARAARLIGMPALIVMPEDTPDVKVQGVLSDGAEIHFYDRFSEDREAISRRIAYERCATIVPSYDDFYIIAGQGTCGLEITKQYPVEDIPGRLICCVGGGGLIAGVSLAVHEMWPETEIFGAEPEDFDDYARSLASGIRQSVSPGSRSICDALLSPSPGELTFALNREHLSGIGLISDEEARHAVAFAFRYLKVVVEPGGAAALAAALSGKVKPKGDKPMVIIMTGGNIDPAVMKSCLDTPFS